MRYAPDRARYPFNGPRAARNLRIRVHGPNAALLEYQHSELIPPHQPRDCFALAGPDADALRAAVPRRAVENVRHVEPVRLGGNSGHENPVCRRDDKRTLPRLRRAAGPQVRQRRAVPRMQIVRPVGDVKHVHELHHFHAPVRASGPAGYCCPSAPVVVIQRPTLRHNKLRIRWRLIPRQPHDYAAARCIIRHPRAASRFRAFFGEVDV